MLGCSSGPAAGDPLTISLVPPPNAMPILGSSVLLSVTTSGGGPVQFQWMQDGTDLPGATGSQLLLFPMARGNAGAYQVRATDGSTTEFTPPFILQPVDQFWVVRTLADSGTDSLREIWTAANSFPGLNGIQFEIPSEMGASLNGPMSIGLGSELPPVTGRLCILGPRDRSLTLDAQAHRPCFVQGGTLILDNFTIANGLGKGGSSSGGGGGAAGMGGAMFINNGIVDLRRMTFKGNQAVGGDSAVGLGGDSGGGGGFGGDSPVANGDGAGGGDLGGTFGSGYLDPSVNNNQGGGLADGDGAGGGAARGGTLSLPVSSWVSNLGGGDGSFGGGGGFSVGPSGGGGNGGDPGGGGGGAGGCISFNDSNGITAPLYYFFGASGSRGGTFGGDGDKGDGIQSTGQGGAGAGLGGAIFFRQGSLTLASCQFFGNQALPGKGNPLSPGLGKGGAIFIYAHDLVTDGPTFNTAMLEAQSYSQNTCTNQPGDPDINPNYDNANFYVAVTPWLGALKRSAAQAQTQELRRLQRFLGWPLVPRP